MVKPTQPKGIKPKAEIAEAAPPPVNEEIDWSGKKLIVINTVITVLVCLFFIGGNYLIVNSIVSSKLENFAGAVSHTEEEMAEENTHERGIILDLGEFILNLSDPDSRRYLKVNVALELSKAPHDPDLHAHADNKGGSHGGHGGGDDAPSPLEQIEAEMNQYKPAIRDAIISVLSSKTTEELSSLAGKELAKEQIKEAIDPIFAGEREVIRVSFGSFIIQ